MRASLHSRGGPAREPHHRPFAAEEMRMRRLAAAVAVLLPVAALADTPLDTVVMAKQIDDIISLDPAESFEFSGSEAIGNIYDRLLTFDFEKVSEIKGQLAESWELAADGRTHRFKLREGMKFASGNPVTAADAAWSLQRAVILNKSPGFILTQFGFSKENAAERIRAEDAATLVLVTEKPVAPSFFYYCLTAVVGSVVDSKTAMARIEDGDYGNSWLRRNSAGSGPYKLRAWRANERYTLEANEHSWAGPPKTRRVVVRHVPEPATQRLLLEKGDIDYARNLTRDQLAAIAADPELAVQSSRKGSLMYLGLNQKNPNLAKPQVREALKYLVDYEAIEKNILASTYVVHQSFLPTGFLGALEERPYRYDLARAKALLAEAGLADGFPVTLDAQNVAPFADVAQAIQAGFAAAGVALEILPADQKQVITKFRARNHDIVLLRWGPDYQDPHTNAETFAVNLDNSNEARAKTLAWRNSWDIPEMSRQALAAVAERDAAKRAAIYEALQREHQKVSPFVILFQEIEVAARRGNVDGFVIGPSFDNNLYAGIEKR
jgi:peptide/nickel transport system substrate-binding protein